MSDVTVTDDNAADHYVEPGYWEEGYAEGDTAAWVIQASESLSVAPSYRKNYMKAIAEALAISATHGKSIALNVAEALAIVRTYSDIINFVLRFNETLGLSTSFGTERVLQFAESLGITRTGISKALSKNFDEDLATAVSFLREVDFQLTFAEAMSIGDAAPAKDFTKEISEALRVISEYIKGVNAVFSDMLLRSNGMTLDDFAEYLAKAAQPGYSDFADFIPGNYDFENALFRVLMQSDTMDRVKMTQLRVDADVPDVTESGSAEITDADAGAVVTFTRTFHDAPDVVMTCKGGTVVAIPSYDPPTKTGFTGYLTDPATGDKVTGAFSWAARGK